MSSTPMDIEAESSPAAADMPQLNITRTLGLSANATSPVSEVIANYRPTKVGAKHWTPGSKIAALTEFQQLFKRDDAKDGKLPYVLSIDFDDPGELCMTSESDETIQIYNVREGRHEKTLLSKKYGVKLAKFTHASSSIIYASTKQNSKTQLRAHATAVRD